jgi:uncharacterized protein
MKFNLDENLDTFAISAYADGWIRIADRRIDAPCVVSSAGIISDLLPATLDELDVIHLRKISALAPEIVLLGTGAKQIFLDYALTEALAAENIALETMDTGAACRCFNILVAEARAVVAALYMI